MASFPTSIFSPRALIDRAGIVYNALKTHTFFAKDHNDITAEIVAIETLLQPVANFLSPIKAGLPTLTDCGTNPVVVAGANDSAGVITVGTSATGCKINFNSTKAYSPVCILVASLADVPLYFYASTTQIVTIPLSGNISGQRLNYICFHRDG
jgi:hypothetical protein